MGRRGDVGWPERAATFTYRTARHVWRRAGYDTLSSHTTLKGMESKMLRCCQTYLMSLDAAPLQPIHRKAGSLWVALGSELFVLFRVPECLLIAFSSLVSRGLYDELKGIFFSHTIELVADSDQVLAGFPLLRDRNMKSFR